MQHQCSQSDLKPSSSDCSISAEHSTCFSQLRSSQNFRSHSRDVTSALDGCRLCVFVCLCVCVCACVCLRVCGVAAMTTTFESRMNGIAQEEASQFKRTPEVFKVHRLPGHLQSKSLTLQRRSRTLASGISSSPSKIHHGH